MKKLTLLLILLWPAMIHVNARYDLPYNKVWVMGNKSGLDFNGRYPAVFISNIWNSAEGCASVCDSSGKLLFYTNGTNVWTAAGVIMPNGTNFNGSAFTSFSTTQGALIVPDPGNIYRYYLFSLTSMPSGLLFCDVVDMRLNDGAGDIDTSFELHRKLIAGGLTEKMTAVAGCRNNVWILVHLASPALFKAYELNDRGLNLSPVISGQGAMVAEAYYGGVIKASPDGKRLLACNTYGYGTGVEVYDFDTETGTASNVRLLDTGGYYGGAFSPDGHLIYAQKVSPSGIYQFNLQAGNPVGLYLGRSRAYSDMKLDPDGKLYFIAFPGSQTSYLGGIEYPDIAGPGCGFRDSISTIVFERSAYINIQYGLPNDVVKAVPAMYNIGSVVLDTLICSGHDSIEVVLHAANYNRRYQWNDGSVDSVKIIRESGVYWISYPMESCGLYTDSFLITIDGLPSWRIIEEKDGLTTSIPFSAYQWYKEGLPLPSATQRIQPLSGSGWYSVMVYSEVGCADSAGLQVENFSATERMDGAKKGVVIYPNPVRDKIYVNAARPLSLKVTDIMGCILARSDNSNGMDIHFLAEGVYLLYVFDVEGELIRIEKMVKQ